MLINYSGPLFSCLVFDTSVYRITVLAITEGSGAKIVFVYTFLPVINSYHRLRGGGRAGVSLSSSGKPLEDVAYVIHSSAGLQGGPMASHP